jgi:hypothetical protein
MKEVTTVDVVHDYVKIAHGDNSVTIPIRMFSTFILPELNKASALQSEHLKIDKEGIPNYSYYEEVIVKFSDWELKKNQSKYAILNRRQEIPDIVSPEIYKKFIDK